MSGLTATGFSPASLSSVQSDIQNALKARLGPSINLVAPSLLATIIGIFSERESFLWSVLQDVYNSQYPDTANGTSLDNVVAITGITRLGSTPTRQATQYLFGTVGTVIPAGTLFSVQGNPTAIFASDSAVTLLAGVNCVQKLSFSSIPTLGTYTIIFGSQTLAPISFAATNTDIQSALNGLSGLSGVNVSGNTTTGFTITFAGASGNQPQPLLIVSASSLTNAGGLPVTVTPSQTLAGVPQASVSITATVNGAIPAPAQSITVINTPIAGLNSTINPIDSVIGRGIETDADLRVRRATTLQIAGSSTPDAIRSKILSLQGVTDVFLFENITLLPDTSGRPPKSYEVVVNGGDPQTITQQIWNTKPAGIQTVGVVTGIAKDSQGNNQTVKWSRPTVIPIYLGIDIKKDFTYPANGDAQVLAAILAYGAGLKIGQSVIISPQLICALDEVPGITGITVRIGIAPNPTLSNNIIIQTAQIAQFDSSRIVVTSL